MKSQREAPTPEREVRSCAKKVEIYGWIQLNKKEVYRKLVAIVN